MCGIAGAWGKVDEGAVREMMDKQAHRGPDEEGIHIKDSIGVLGHKRLSIMDPAGGRQPIENEDSSAVIVANGAIYNFFDMRENLNSSHRFRTTNDSEIILHMFEEHGHDAVRQLDGMFAFAIDKDGDLFLARDPIGIKPLYYGFNTQKNSKKDSRPIYIASELKAFLDMSLDVYEFPPGTFYQWNKDTFDSYYTIPDKAPLELTVDQHIKRLRETLEKAVEKRLMSDVPLGAFLSGGLDSSIIAALVKLKISELHTFSVGIEGSRDIEAARLVSRHIGSIHHEYIYKPEEVIEKLPEIIYYLESFDQDLVRSGIPCYFCSRLASENVKVILTGEGADELFAGYTYYKGYDDFGLLHKELRRSVASLHNVNLQRVDRMTMAHAIEGRVPFLDMAMIEMAQTIPPELKLYKDEKSGRYIEKWVLRKAFEDLLPPEILWRDKEQFDEGSGTVDILDKLIKKSIAGFDVYGYINTHKVDQIRSPEEAFYHKILLDVFRNSRVILTNVGRWSYRN